MGLGIKQDFELSIGETLYFKIGNLRSWIKRLDNEVQLANSYDELEVDEEFAIGTMELPHDLKVSRWAWENDSLTVSLIPTLHNRDLVFRATKPISIPTRERADFYVSPCLTIDINFNSKFILNVPIIKYSETWFGKDPTVGDLCYAVKIRGVTVKEEILMQKYRFLCHVCVFNESVKPITIDKLKVLTDYMRLYQDEEGFVYSDTLTIKQAHDGNIKLSMAKPQIKNKSLKKIYDSRSAFQTLFMKAFSVFMEY